MKYLECPACKQMYKYPMSNIYCVHCGSELEIKEHNYKKSQFKVKKNTSFQCCICKRMLSIKNTWIIVNVSKINDLFTNSKGEVKISHSYCPDCHKTIMEQIKEGKQ